MLCAAIASTRVHNVDRLVRERRFLRQPDIPPALTAMSPPPCHTGGRAGVVRRFRAAMVLPFEALTDVRARRCSCGS